MIINNAKIQSWKTLFLVFLLAASASAETVILNGGQLEVGEPVTVIANPTNHINFPTAVRWTVPGSPDVYWATYNVGTQAGTPTPVAYRAASTDGGNTWDHTVPLQTGVFSFHSTFGPINSTQLADGKIRSIGAGLTDKLTERTVRSFTWSSPTGALTESFPRPVILFPFATSLFTYRSLVVLPGNGGWVQSAYGQRDSELGFSSFVLKSVDQGQSWTYLSDIARPLTPAIDQSGPNETSMTLLADGSVLAHVRQGHGVLGPLLQLRSYDGGATWTDQTTLDPAGGLNPMVVRLANNTLVSTYGRRSASQPEGVWMSVDFTGTGDHWQRFHLYEGMGSNYASIVPFGSDAVKIFYDISGYGSRNLPAGQANRLVYTVVQVPEAAALAFLLMLPVCIARKRMVTSN